MGAREYYLYDGRASGAQGTDNALCLSAGLTRQDAWKYSSSYSTCACYSYVIEDAGDTVTLADERWEWDYWPDTGHVGPANKRTG